MSGFIILINLKLIIIPLLMLIKALESVNITEFKVPEIVNHGSDAELSCKYNLTRGEVLYTIKWYKEENEFYRYEPKEKRQVLYFPVPGINIDRERSNYTRIVLREVNNQTSGTFVCEVSVDISFITAMSEAMMLIKSNSIGFLPSWSILIVTILLSSFISS
ncbi:uncharacterized protein LOC128395120 [Panonychus citri]|uniref:uncharacterized protein LOC128395120 n=1 Tax=Panonychus citri TaxID=50023 RepID=UPI0023071455|nr:uncharacterized protein LOC128395120 [Panonychus citri]